MPTSEPSKNTLRKLERCAECQHILSYLRGKNDVPMTDLDGHMRLDYGVTTTTYHLASHLSLDNLVEVRRPVVKITSMGEKALDEVLKRLGLRSK